jgi:3-oxoacyl-[acyl-carrier protein] reductase
MVAGADVSDRTQVDGMVRRIEAEFGPVSLLVNNAGIAGQALFQNITDDLWHRYFSVNVDGAFHAIQAVLPYMLREHAGCIINISSIWGLRGASCEVTYSATKAALIGLTRSLAAELAPTHIRVNCVAPGVIRTDMLDALPPEVLPQLAQETPLGRLGTPEDIAAAVAFLSSEEADFITGQVLTSDGGFIL